MYAQSSRPQSWNTEAQYPEAEVLGHLPAVAGRRSPPGVPLCPCRRLARASILWMGLARDAVPTATILY